MICLLPDSEIISDASIFTLASLKAQGLSRADYRYSELENILHQAKETNSYAIGIIWSGKTYCFITSASPIKLHHLAPEQIKGAYRQSFYDSNRIYSLG